MVKETEQTKTPSDNSTQTGSKAEVEKMQSFQKHLALLDHPTEQSIRSFVGSPDFIEVLTTCTSTNTPRLRSLAFMILARLFNPSSPEQYPLSYIIEQCAACFTHCLDQGKNETKLLAYRTLSAIFQTSMTVGAAILCQEGTVEEMMELIEFETVEVQVAMVDVLSMGASDPTCQKQIRKYAIDWLVKAAKLQDPAIKQAAVTCLTKLKAQPQDKEEQDNTLEEAMRRMHLTNASLTESLADVIKSKSSDRTHVLNAVEGLAYHSLQPDVKDALGTDNDFLQCLSTLAISTTQEERGMNPLLFGIGTIFANLTMYRPVLDEKQKQIKKLRDLANAKQNKPTEDDPREDNAAVEKRIERAVKHGVVLALMVLAKNNSTNLQTLAAQTYLSIVTPTALRGQLLQQGIVKALLPLSRLYLTASQALAKLAITTDPRLAFPGETMLDLVKPMLNLCQASHPLQQFEGLMALTNLASVEERVRLLIENAGAMNTFETLQLSDHPMIQRAATELVCNMTLCEPVFDRYSQSQNQIRLLMILSDHSDPATRRAASGALAILANSPETCERMVKVDRWAERIVQWLALDETVEVQHRGIEVVRLLLTHQPSARTTLMKHGVDQKLALIVKQVKVQVVHSAALEVLSTLSTHQ